MKKGFTLIELLAVIVILAIIATIATPIVLSIIDDAKKSATLRSAAFYLDGVENSIATSILHNINIKDGEYSIMKDGNICLGTLSNNVCDRDILKIEVKGEKPSSGTIKIESGQIGDVSLTLSDNIVVKDDKGELILSDKNVDNKLEPGLYDQNDNLIASWQTLIDAGLNTEDITADNRQVLEKFANSYKLVIAESVTSIGIGAFSGCTGLTNITVPNSVTSIGDHAFDGCTSLTSITLPTQSIGGWVFSGCTSLTSINFFESTEISNSISIYNSAFDGCTSLTSITIPENVTSIDDSAFIGCTNLTTIYYKGTATGSPWGATNATVVTDF